MPRAKAPGAKEPKKRSRTGCWTCKAKKVKCGEEKPKCLNCIKNSEPVCDYSIRLNWEGRTKRKAADGTPDSPEMAEGSGSGMMQMISFQPPASTSRHKKPNPIASPPPDSPAAKNTSSAVATPVSATHSHLLSESSRPSSSHSRTGSTPASTPTPSSSTFTQSRMPPPLNTHSPLALQSPPFSEHRDKRPRPNPTSAPYLNAQTIDYLSPHVANLPPSTTADLHFFTKPTQRASAFQSGGSGASTPGDTLTPSASSVASDETAHRISTTYLEDPRRLSVNSLLVQEEQIKKHERDPNDSFVDYGIDRGIPDLDIPGNNDRAALEVITPTQSMWSFDGEMTNSPPEFGFGLFAGGTMDQTGGYDTPMTVKIARSLHPLPSLLVDNPMNLMYFHFFQASTARILVPHDCPQNPFSVILPQMAVRDDNLLHLLLAYSASHRARLLKHPEPSNRIALWVKDIFTHLSKALDDTASRISNSNLATAIMLASLEIIAPNTFGSEVQVPWQDHLAIAREMIIARGGPRAVNRAKDRVSYFLVRWFAYLDILGSFSSTGVRAGQAMFTGDLYDFEDDKDFKIDCVLGFSGSLATLLAKTADLARRCDSERLDGSGQVDPAWKPTPAVAMEAEQLKLKFLSLRNQDYHQCPHLAPSSKAEAHKEAIEMSASNQAFMWAGLIHLNRRTLALTRESEDVQMAVAEVVRALRLVQKGGSAEACLLFPLFTAGCEALKDEHRETISERFASVGLSGMTQVHKARKLMEKVWETGMAWETLVQGEFFG